MLDVNNTILSYISNVAREFEGQTSFQTFSVFFEPRDEFTEWMKEFCANKTVIDCGCGRGQAVLELRNAGINAIGIDLHGAHEPFIDDVHFMNAFYFPFGPEYVAMMCRPCRGDWIHATIIKAVESGSKFVYVGKESHYEQDLQPLPYKVELVLGHAGLDNESVWVISNDK